MSHRRWTLSVTAALAAGLAGPAQAAPRGDAASQRVDVYTGDLTAQQFRVLREAGVDQHGVLARPGAATGQTRVEVTITGVQARRLAGRGVALELKRQQGLSTAQRAATVQETVFRPYSGAGNLREELLQLPPEPADRAGREIGHSVSGKPITAVRVSKNVAHLKDQHRPAVVYQAAQHAREWITPEMVRRPLRHYLDGYGRDRDRELTKIIDTTDLWFIPVVNVDGYDYTFTEDNRLWRKNLRDNDGDGDGDGAITAQIRGSRRTAAAASSSPTTRR